MDTPSDATHFATTEPRRICVMRILRSLVSPAIAALLVWSAIGKTIDPLPTLKVFTDVLRFPAPTAYPAAAALIIIEFVLAGWLFSGAHRTAATFATAVFLLTGSVSILIQLLSRSRLGCGCGLPTFGLSPESGQLMGLFRNVVLIFLILIGGVSPSQDQGVLLMKGADR